MKKYKLGGTFLLQYDALIDPRYQQLLKNLPADSFEIGAWWEIPQSLVERAGMKWRGRYPWDWRANIGFATGYTPEERKKLIDVYMADFKKLFGYYPKSVASWFIDAYSLNYMYEKYAIVASANCKDQYGTDGYTLWGGYWNQAYYPSKVNSYMPAQTAKNQIPVPIFRLLGSDPIRQYDNGLGTNRQGVVTLEPVYAFGGGDSTWVNWFLNSFANDPSLGFNYLEMCIRDRIFNAPVEAVWQVWVDPELVKRWWGPKHFTSPVAKIDFLEGGHSVVSMKAPKEMGEQEFYSRWVYTKITKFENIEF